MVSRFEVWPSQEVTTAFWNEEQHITEHDQEPSDAHDVFTV